MTDLDQLLAETFERRAALAPTSALSAELTHRAIRRDRRRRALHTGAVLGTVVLVAGLLSLTRGDIDRRARSAPGTATHSARVVASLPWGNGDTLTLRQAESDPGYYEFCFSSSCPVTVDVRDTTLSDQGSTGSIYGLAPPGTSRVTVAVAGAAPVPAEVVAADVPGSTVVFGTPSVHNVLYAAASTMTRTERLKAYDVHGRLLGATTVLGSYDLGAAHPPAGQVVSFPAPSVSMADDRDTLAWGADDGWVCNGRKGVVHGHDVYGAGTCAPAARNGVALVTSRASEILTAAGSPDYAEELYVLSVAPGTSRLLLREPGKPDTEVPIHRSGQEHLAVLSSEHTLQDDTLIGLGEDGSTTFTAPMSALKSPAGGQDAAPGE